MTSPYEAVKRHILLKMVAHRMWQHKHMSIHNLPKGLPPHARDMKMISDIVSALIKRGWIIAKPTHYGLEVSLNVRHRDEIMAYLEQSMP